MITSLQFFLPDMVCEICSTTVKSALNNYLATQKQTSNALIKGFRVNSVCNTLSVDVEGIADKNEVFKTLKGVLEPVGQTCVMEREALPGQPSLAPTSWFSWFKKQIRSHVFLGTLGVTAGIVLLILPFMVTLLPLVGMIAIAVISTLLTLIIGAEFYLKAIKQVEIREPAMDLLFALSTVVVIAVSIAAFFVPGLPMMFEVGLLIFGFRHVGLAIRDSIYNGMGVRARFQDKAPSHVLKRMDDTYVSTPLADINPNDVVLIVPNGKMIPLDGWYDVDPNESEPIEGRLISIANIDGITKPKRYMPGDRLLAGMVLQSGEKPMRMKVDVSGYALRLTSQKPPNVAIQSHEIVLYRDGEALYFAARDATGEVQRIALEDKFLIDKQGFQHAKAIRALLSEAAQAESLTIAAQNQIFMVSARYGFIGPPVRHSNLERIDRSIELAESQKGPVKKTTEQILRYFVPVMLILALLAGLILAFFFPIAIAIQCAVAVLVSACPCTLGLITPLAITIGMQKAAGVTFNQAIEEADEIDCVVFDLHGTLTTGKIAVASCEVLVKDDLTFNQKTYQAYFALLEQQARHPIGKAIYDFVGGDKTISNSTLQVTDLDQKSHHSGLTAKIDGQKYILGNRDMMLACGVKLPAVKPGKSYDSIVYLVRETCGEGAADQPQHTLLSYIVLNDPLRKDACETVQLLRARGTRVCICTGADKETALHYASQLGIPSNSVGFNRAGVAGQVNKETKESFINELKLKGHRVLMVGDAANDSVAMKASDFSIAMKHLGGNETTQQLAGAVIESGSLLSVVTALDVSKQTVANIKQNLLFSLIYNIAAVLLAGGLLLTVGIVLNPGICVALMIVQTCLILLNAYRFQQQELPHLKSEKTAIKCETPSSYSKVMQKTPGKRHEVQPNPEPVYNKQPKKFIAQPQQLPEQQTTCRL